jgi:hypothetical protein
VVEVVSKSNKKVTPIKKVNNNDNSHYIDGNEEEEKEHEGGGGGSNHSSQKAAIATSDNADNGEKCGAGIEEGSGSTS